MALRRAATAVWRGALKEGSGVISTQTKVINNTPYSFNSRFENGAATNPEELVAAAHASCYSMAVSAQLGNAGLKPEYLNTTATLTMKKDDKGWTATDILLELSAKVPGASEEQVKKAAEDAKVGCPISRLLKADIKLNVKVDN